MEAAASLSYPSGPLAFASRLEVAYASASLVNLVDLQTGSARALRTPENRGVTALASHAGTRRLAISLSGNGGDVLVRDLPRGGAAEGALAAATAGELRLEQSLARHCTLLRFSRGGDMLLGLGDSADLSLVVWSVKDKALLAKAALPFPCTDASFNPANPEQLLTCGPKGAVLWTLERVIDAYSLLRTPVDLLGPAPCEGRAEDPAAEGVEARGIAGGEPGTMASTLAAVSDEERACVLSHAWLATGQLLLATAAGGIVRVENASGLVRAFAPVVPKSPDGDALGIAGCDGHLVVGMLSTTAHLIVAFRGGIVSWLAQDRLLAPPALSVDAVGRAITDDRIVAFATNAAFDRLCIGTRSGLLRALHLDDLSNLDAAPAFTTLRDFHRGRCLGVVRASNERQEELFASAGEDGSLRLWKSGGVLPVARRDFQDGDAAPVAVTSVEALPGRAVLAAGLLTGHVTLLAAVDSGGTSASLRDFLTVRVSARPISAIAAAGGSLLVADGFGGRVSVLDVSDMGNAKVSFQCAAGAQQPVTCLCWLDGDSEAFCFATADGNLHTARAAGGERRSEPNMPGQTLAAPGDAVVGAMLAMPASGKGGVLLASPQSDSLWLAQLPCGRAEADGAAAAAAVLGVFTVGAGGAGVTQLAASANGEAIAAFDAVGGATVFAAVAGGRELSPLRRIVPGGTSAVLGGDFSGAGNALHVALADGGLVSTAVEDLAPAPLEEASSVTVAAPSSEKVVLLQSEKPWADLLAAQEAEKRSAENASVLDGRRKQLAEIAGALRDLLRQNGEAAEIERLERHEFVVDAAGFERTKEETAQAVEDGRAEIRTRNDDVALLAARVRALGHDSMEVHLCEVRCLGDAADAAEAPSALNFPIRRQQHGELRTLEVIKRMRALEVRCAIAAGAKDGGAFWPGLLDEVPRNVSYVLGQGLLRPHADIVAGFEDGGRFAEGDGAAGGAEGAAAGGSPEGDGDHDGDDEDDEDGRSARADIDLDDVSNLLYPPAAVRTPHQQRMQVRFLQQLVVDMKRRFNERFDALRSDKQNCIFAIEEKTTRIHEILAELQSSEPVYKPALAPSEQPERLLQVADSELQTKPYESAEAAARREADEERRRKAAAEAGLSMEERALVDMMNGTLEVKKDSLATQLAPERPQWMEEVPEADMDDEQRREVAEYDEKLRIFEEEREKHRKALGLELKKLQTDVAELVRAFNEKVSSTTDQRLSVQYVISAHESYSVALSKALLENEWRAHELRDLERDRVALQGRQRELGSRIAAFRAEAETVVAARDEIVQEQRQLERQFKPLMHGASTKPLDQDALLLLVEAFQKPASSGDGNSPYSAGPGSSNDRGSPALPPSARRASMARRRSFLGTRRNSRLARSSNVLQNDEMAERMRRAAGARAEPGAAIDPFCAADEVLRKRNAELRGPLPEVPPVALDPDVSEMVEDGVKEKLQELRAAKIHKERLARRKDVQLAELKRQMLRVVDEQDAVAAQLARIDGRRLALREQSAARRNDPLVLLRLRQGLDEVAESPVELPDYGDARLIPVAVVERINESIRKLGDEKVKTLTKMKNYRKRINFMAWEVEYMDRQAVNLEQHYTDLQLLRVTKNLQAALKGDAGPHKDRERVERTEQRMSVMGKTHKDKVDRLGHQLRKVLATVRERTTENARLVRQVKELETAVEQREGIYRSRKQARGSDLRPEKQAAQRMKRVMVRRRLVDIARAQSDEITWLQGELDRLRRRTFPSFADAAPAARGPDERA